MASSKRTKAAPTDGELDSLFEGLGGDTAVPKKPTTKSSKATAATTANEDILAELESQIGSSSQPAPSSRPHTPRIKDTATTAKGSPSVTAAAAARRSAESARSSSHPALTPSATSSAADAEGDKKDVGGTSADAGPSQQPAAPAQGTTSKSGGSSWWGWGGIVAQATAAASVAMKTAEAAVKEIQQNDEAKKWAEQVRGNVGALKGIGDELRHRALPTFTNLLHTLAPPISAHERLRIHTTHDLVGYPSLDPLIHGVFSRVMAQVEGGDLLVVQRGHESQSARASSVAGWRDGPWWRQVDGQPPRDLGVVRGLVEGTKLARANAEAYAHEFFAAEGGIEEARRRAAEPLSESVPVRCSDIFLAVQAVGVDADKSLFAGSSSSAEKEDRDANASDQDEELVLFAVYLLDPVHDIAYSSVGQGIPARWTRWLDAGTASPLTPASSGAPTATSEPEDDDDTAGSHFSNVPEEIRDIVESGGVDPREWVAEWLEEALQLTVGIAAQRYVARRMGVGLSAAGEEAEIKGKRKADVSNGAGEAARAGLI